MTLFQFFMSYLIVDAVLSLIVFAGILIFRKSLLNVMRYRLRSYLGINSIESRLPLENDEEYDDVEEDLWNDEDDEDEMPKQAFQDNLKTEFDLK